jgi:hypothetical protein
MKKIRVMELPGWPPEPGGTYKWLWMSCRESCESFLDRLPMPNFRKVERAKVIILDGKELLTFRPKFDYHVFLSP